MLQVGLHRFEPLTNIGIRTGLYKGDGPLVDIAVEKLDVLASLGPDKIVRDGFIVMQKIILDGIALVSEAEDEVLVPEMSVIFHQMPENRTWPNRHHGLRNILRVASESHSGTAAKQDDFHVRSLRTSLSKLKLSESAQRTDSPTAGCIATAP